MSITVDRVQLEIAVKHDKTRQEIAQVTDSIATETDALKKLKDEKRKAMKKYKDESHPEVVKATRAYEEQAKKVEVLRRRKDELRSSLKVEGLSISELRDELRRYNMQLNNLTPGTEKFQQTKGHIDDLKRRLKDLTTEAKSTKETLADNLSFFNKIGFAVNNFFDTTSILSGIHDTISQATELARTAEGVEMAFRRIDSPGLLDNLRSATHGTVSDLELMRQAVQFKDFNLDVEQLGSFLAYAQQKAKDTGQSVDYLVNSIVTGLGRKSKQILDNLGISASEIDEEMKSAGDMTKAVANIIQRNMAAAGDYVETAADRAARAAAQQQNALLELGHRLLPIADTVAGIFNAILAGGTKVLGFLVDNRNYIITLGAALTAYVAIVKAHAIAEELRAAKTWLAEKAQRALNLAQKASPVGLIVAGITALITALVLFSKKSDAATEATNRLSDAQRKASDDYVEEQYRIKKLTATVNDNTLSLDTRRKALEELKSIVPGYNALLDEEGRLTRNNTAAIDEYLKKRKEELLVRAYEEQLVEAYKRQADAMGRLTSAIETFKKTGSTSGFGDIRDEAIEANTAVARLEKALEQTQHRITKMQESSGNVLPEVTVTPTKTTTRGSGAHGGSRKESPLEQHEKQLKADYDKNLLLLKEARQKEALTEEQYQQQKYLAEQKYLRDLGALREQYNADEAQKQEVQNRQLDALIAERQRQEQQRQQEMQATLATAQMSYNVDQVALEQQFWQGDIASEQEYQAKKLELERDYQQQRISIIQQYGGDATDVQLQLYQLEIDAAKTAADRKQKELEKQFASGTMTAQQRIQAVEQNAEVLGWQRTQEMKTQILRDEEQKRTQIQQEAASAVGNILQSTSSLFSALQQRETAQVDAKYKRLIAAAKKQGRDTTKLEEQQEQERMEIQKKYAQKQFRLQVLQIIASTAQAIANVWKQWAANPPIAAALSAVAAAQGAIQLATAKAQAEQAAGLYEGGYSEGYTKRGDPRKQAGVIPVHQSEFVANHHAVGNPQLRPLFDAIDLHQRRGDVQLLNATRLLQEAYGSGRAQGGFTGEGGSTAAVGLGNWGTMLRLMMEVLERIERNTAQSLTVRKLRDEISHEERLERNARR